MSAFLNGSAYFAMTLSVLSYLLGLWLRKKTGWVLMNPLLISIVVVIGTLLLLGVEYETYSADMQPLSYLLTPTTACLAIPLYEQIHLLKRYSKAILLGIMAGVLANMLCVLALSALFRLDHTLYVTLLPKSITTAMALGVAEELGGIGSITTAAIMVSGVLGNIAAEFICKLFRIRQPVAIGTAIGSASHAMGTSKALEIGDVEGAMSSLSIAVCGLLTVVVAPIFANFY